MQSAAMRQLDRVVRIVAAKDVVVSGTGKEVLARRLHELSGRHDGPFVPINCAAIPEALFESELFGHEKGAFTGASDRVKGKIEAAMGGTLFLDEIGDMPIGAQAKLLRFLENRRFMRVGGSTKISADIRLITATLRPLEDEVKAGSFRADLFYRIEGVTLRVPPLRERVADLVPLVQQFVAHASAKHGVKPPRLARATMAALRAYHWPGNVRELRNAIQLLCLMREGKEARVRDLPARIREVSPTPRERVGRTHDTTTTMTMTTTKGADVLAVRLDRPLEETVERILQAALDLEQGNRSRAARRLSVGLRTMQRYAARSNLPRPQRR